MRQMLVILLVGLMVVPSDARAHQLGLGAGYVDGDCSILANTDSDLCFRGGRWELFWNVHMVDAGKEVARSEVIQDPASAEASSGVATATDASRGKYYDWLDYTNYGSWTFGDKGDALVLAFVLGLLLVAGIFWALVYLFSTRTKFGFFYSSDRQEAPVVLGGNRDGIESYQVDKLGTQVSFYPARSVDIQLHFGVAAASARIRTYEKNDEVTNYNLHGTATKAGIGYMPFPEANGSGRHGPYLLAEFEGAFYGDSALRRTVEDQRKLLPQYRSNAAVMMGYTASW